MGQLQPAVDLTGALSSADLSSQDIQNIMAEFNKLQSQLTSGNISQNQQNIIVFDNTTNRVLIGYQTVLQQWGLFVSKPGIDVTKATADQLVFNSNQDTFKIVLTDSVVVTVNFPVVPGTFADTTTQTATINHNLGYVPACEVFLEFSGSTRVPISHDGLHDFNFTNSANGDYQIIRYIVEITSTTLTVGLERQYFVHSPFSTDGIVNVPYTFKYYLLQETAS